MQRFSKLVCLFLLAMLPAVRVSARQPPVGSNVERVRSTARVLTSTYDPATGLFKGTGWWNSANGITALANVSLVLHSREFDSIFSNTFFVAGKAHPSFLNEFYDDEGSWALAWLDVYQLDKDQRYLAMSESLFYDMSGGWSDTCGGGIWWKKNEHYKNAIANELFLSVAVRLAQVTSGDARAHYIDWAKKEELWFAQSGIVNDKGLVNDGLDATCHNNGGTTWTYNQGVILTGLVGLSDLTKDASTLALANRIALAAGLQLVDKAGVLHDVCEPKCGADGIQFKGILVRNIAVLAVDQPSQELMTLLKTNAASVWTNAQTDDGHFSVDWAGPPQDSGTGSLISALDALTAALLASLHVR